ncbi:hypothetical protein [Pontibacter sp. G13]|uniref:hypothetical protein n=1 Tax=Pontibacter sp. G13 TaxID=3074898 RepID=UPI00288C5ED6|nr:hypothetical protein [Pontibacter sp. G13]WNJ20795.1 hypothetical protein RJD25_09955 [Pontibacter sp. G13]
MKQKRLLGSNQTFGMWLKSNWLSFVSILLASLGALGIWLSYYSANNSSSCNVSYPGDRGSISLSSGDTVCIPAGNTYRGSVASFPNGAAILVETGATFNPSSFSGAAGYLQVDGDATLKSPTFAAGFELNVSGYVFLQQSASVNGMITIEVAENATLEIQKAFSFSQAGSIWSNQGTVTASKELTFGTGTVVQNVGEMTSAKSVIVEGTFENYETFDVKNLITINSGGILENNCKLIVIDGILNSGSLVNEGNMFLEGAGGSWKGYLTNQGTLVNGTNASIVGKHFTNTSSVTGSGYFFFSMNTSNTGDFGLDGSGINFQDSSPTGSNIFDTQGGNIDPSVTAFSLIEPTTDDNPASCSNYSGSLPVVLAAFEVEMDDREITLDWISTSEVNFSHFEIQASWDGREFSEIGQVPGMATDGQGAPYQFSEPIPLSSSGDFRFYRLNMVDLDGTQTFSDIQQVRIARQVVADIRFWNTGSGDWQLAYSGLNGGVRHVRVVDLAGRTIWNQSVNWESSTSQSLRLPDMAAGVYVLSLLDERGAIQSQKFRVQ